MHFTETIERDFWTYPCINSLRPLPFLRNGRQKIADADFAVIGVHTPEFSFEHEPMHVENAVHNLNVTLSAPAQRASTVSAP